MASLTTDIQETFTSNVNEERNSRKSRSEGTSLKTDPGNSVTMHTLHLATASYTLWTTHSHSATRGVVLSTFYTKRLSLGYGETSYFRRAELMGLSQLRSKQDLVPSSSRTLKHRETHTSRKGTAHPGITGTSARGPTCGRRVTTRMPQGKQLDATRQAAPPRLPLHSTAQGAKEGLQGTSSRSRRAAPAKPLRARRPLPVPHSTCSAWPAVGYEGPRKADGLQSCLIQTVLTMILRK